MSNESTKTKSPKISTILLICIIVVLLAIVAGLLIVASLKNKTSQGGETAISQTETTISSANSEKFNAPFKYDLKNNQLSNFDIAFLKAENKKENKIYSPLSIKYTLKMLEEGAKGNSKQQISNVLEDYVVTKYTSNSNMSLANALFIRDTFKDKVNPNYASNLQSKYNAEVVYDSFANATNVNNWVKNKTLNLLPEVLDTIRDDQDFLLINSLGIDMEWKNKFFEENSYEKGFRDEVAYQHENYHVSCNTCSVESRKFDNDKLEVSGMEIMASIDNYDIVKTLGEDSIRKTVGDAYRKFIAEKGYGAWGEKLNTQAEIDAEVEKYLNDYIEALKLNYNEHRAVSSIDFSLYTDSNVKAFSKDLKEYNGTTLQYIGIMPTNEELDKYVKDVDSDKINDIIKNMKDIKNENFKQGAITRVTGFIPKFKFDYDLDLINDLAQIGITDVFDQTKADISDIVSMDGAYIGDAVHKANIEFTQDGIKASATTVFAGKGAGDPEFDYVFDVPIEEIDLTFDKPYMFIIRDKETGDVWFSGTVYEPLAWANDTSKDTSNF